MFNSTLLKNQFNDFLAPECDRALFISNILEQGGLSATTIHVDDKKHIYVNFPQNQYNGMFRIKTIIAHYDRVPDTPGANDNSIAVFTLAHWAVTLSHSSALKQTQHNIRLIFTDGEELSSDGVESQGSYSLAKHFQRIPDEDIFVFDCMGRGDVPVLCESGSPLRGNSQFIRQFQNLDARAEKILSQSSDKWMRLPTKYSDNAGFLACGIPAVAFTMLPSKEAENYLKFTMKYGSRNINECQTSPDFRDDFKKLYPPTWLMLHSQFDDTDHLTAEAEEVFLKILGNLANLKTLR